MRPGAEGPVRSDAPGKFDVTVLPPTKKAPSSSRVSGPPRVAERAGATPEASIAIASVLRGEHALQDQAPLPQPAHQLQVGPREPIALPVAAGGAGDERDARAHVLEMRHAVDEQRAQEHSEEPAGPERALPGEAQRR